LCTERGLASRAIRSRLTVPLRARLRIATPMLTEDRRVLEQIIFPHYARDAHIKTVLFVGCDWYTAHYQHRYFSTHNYWTLEPDKTHRRFGAKQHVAARLEELGRHFPQGFFDLIICNGVYGWGLDRAEDCEAAMSQCHTCLAQGGHLLLGWNDTPQRDPAPLSRVRSLARFSPYSFPAFGAWQYLTNTRGRHVYYFYQKRN
jgi:SAM-dependent methyltransferase